MLVLTRKPGESIAIGEDIVVTVLTVNGGQVRVGISAPASVRVLREEIYSSLKEENRAAATGLRDKRILDGVLPRLQEKRDQKG